MMKPPKKPARAGKPRRKLRRLPAGAEKAQLTGMAAASEQLRNNPLARALYQQLAAAPVQRV